MLTLCLFAVQEHLPSHPNSSQASASPGPAASPAPEPEFFIVIDPGHGGDDKGVVFTQKISEKDVTLAFARALRKELQQRGMNAHLLRDGDVTLPLERRAEIINQQHPALYVALHAGVPGNGVRLYSALLQGDTQPLGTFIPWDAAQAAALERSRTVVKMVAQELKKKEFKVSNLQACLRPMNNVVSPAMGVEIAVERNNVRSLVDPSRQNAIVSALASGIVQSQIHLGAHK